MLGDDDDGWGRRGFGVYPTLINREGPDVGRAQENGMARGVTWPNGCQTVEFQNHDGSITSYRTHGGMPQVTTNEIVVEAPVCIIEELTSPLTETSYAARTYHADERFYSYNGVWSLPFKPIKSITVTTGDAVPQTRKICLSGRSAAAVRTAETDLVEVSRDYTASNAYQRVYLPGFFLQFSFEQILIKVHFQGKCGRPLTLKTYPTGASTASPHGSVFGNHVVYGSTITNYRYTEYRARTDVTTNKFYITLAAPGKMFEEIEDAALTKLNNLVTPSPNAPFPAAERKVKAFGGSKGFVRNNGRLYTDNTFATLVDAVTSYPATVDLFNTPIYFRLTANADYTVPGTPMVFKGDVIFNKAPFPGLTFTGDFQSYHTLASANRHIFKTAAGEVWCIYVLKTNGSGSTQTDNYRVYLGWRFDRIADRGASVDALLANLNLRNYSTWSDRILSAGLSGWVDPADAASEGGAASIFASGNIDPATWTGAPTYRPFSIQVVSSADGKECYVIGYYTADPSNADEKRIVTSIVKLVFSEIGTADPITGAGISCTATEIPVVTEYLYTYEYSVTGPSNLHFPSRDRESTTVEDIGTCGGVTLHRTTTYDRAYMHAVFATAGHVRLKTILWVYPRNTPASVYPAANNLFDVITGEFYRETARGWTWDVEDTVTTVTTNVCDNNTTGAQHSDVVTTPSYSNVTSAPNIDFEGRLSLVGTVAGSIGRASAVKHTLGATDTYSIEWGPSGTGTPIVSLLMRNGQTYYYPACLYSAVDYTPPNKLVRGQAVPVAAQNSLVCVDVRNNSVYIAPTAADSGIFY